MPETEKVRLEIAFVGGQGLTVLVPAATADDLERALASDETASISFEAEDGFYTLAVRKIVFAKRYAAQSRVGFGA